MSGVKFRITKSAVALTAATVKTVLQVIAAANHRVEIDYIEVSFDGVSTTDQPVLTKVMRQTTAIGGTPAANNPVKVNNGDDETLQTTGAIYGGSPTEPTSGDVYAEAYLHPQGHHIIPGPFVIKGGDRLGIVCTAPVGVNATVTARGEE